MKIHALGDLPQHDRRRDRLAQLLSHEGHQPARGRQLVVEDLARRRRRHGHRRWGYGGGAGVRLGTILLVLLLAYMLGVVH